MKYIKHILTDEVRRVSAAEAEAIRAADPLEPKCWQYCANKPTLREAVFFSCQLADETRERLIASGEDYFSAVSAGNYAADAVLRIMGIDPDSPEVFAEREAYLDHEGPS